jgi:hypothetical protein
VVHALCVVNSGQKSKRGSCLVHGRAFATDRYHLRGVLPSGKMSVLIPNQITQEGIMSVRTESRA